MIRAFGLAVAAAGVLAVNADVAPPKPLGVTFGTGTRLLVLSPHPDDESLGAAGVIRRVVKAGGTVRVVFLTSGDAFAEGVEMSDRISNPTSKDYRNYGTMRERESVEALALLGVDRKHITFLGFPDDGLCLLASRYLSAKRRLFESPYTDRVSPPLTEQVIRGVKYRGADVRREVEQIVGDFKPTTLVLPHPEDDHPDHCSTHIFGRDVMDSLVKQGRAPQTRVLHYLIHYEQWPLSGEAGVGSDLNPPSSFPRDEGRWVSLALTPDEATAKKQALLAYPSQMLVIGRFMLAFGRNNELFIEGEPASMPECWCNDGENVATETPPSRVPAAATATVVSTVREHLDSLDVFRGLAGTAMILVNNPGNWGAVFPPLVHSNWNGTTLADVVFPSFVFIIGVTLPFTFAKRRERTGNGRLLRAILVRGILLFTLGLLLNAVDGFPPLDTLRIPGVLQRIALAYVVASPIVLATGPVGWLAWAAVLLGAHWVILALVSFGGVVAGTMTPEHNVAGLIDAAVFGRHLLTPTYDPEGLLGTLSTAATVLGGALAGAWLRVPASAGRRVWGLLVVGAATVGVGLLWAAVLPLNKTLWTGSYAVTTSGIAAIIFAVCYFTVDVRRIRWFAPPFIWLGVNPLAIYFLSELARHLLDYAWIRQAGRVVSLKDVLFWRYLARAIGDLGGSRSSFMFALMFAALWIGVAGMLYRRDIRIRV